MTENNSFPTAILDDPRKTARLASSSMTFKRGAVQVVDAELAKSVLRSKHVKQAGFGAEEAAMIKTLNNPPVAMVDGEEHRRMRAATARFFSPTAVKSRYTPLMEGTSDTLIAQFRAKGSARLEDMSMEMAVTIAADIVGLTASDMAGMSRRLSALLGGAGRYGTTFFGRLLGGLVARYYNLQFFLRDVRPAIAERRHRAQDDVISHLLSLGYSEKEILVECLIYGIAGMGTTREFIVIAFWKLMEDEKLKQRFLASDRREQMLFLEEVLRTEPIVGQLARRSTEDIESSSGSGKAFPAGTLFEIDVRAANADESAVGPRSKSIDPDRAVAQKPGGSMFAFGDGVHRCPGAQVAMLESAIFLDRLLLVPGIRLISQPKIEWMPMIAGYEVSNAEIACYRV